MTPNLHSLTPPVAESRWFKTNCEKRPKKRTTVNFANNIDSAERSGYNQKVRTNHLPYLC